MSETSTVVVVGMGQLGSELAAGLSAFGHRVVPVTREGSLAALAQAGVEQALPELVALMMGETDLDEVLAAVPPALRDRLLLVQNELLPRDWERHGLPQPTVAVVWFEKKAGRERRVILETPVSGPRARLVVDALRALPVPAREVPLAQLPFEMVAKNLYILTTNLAGLEVGGTVGELERAHRPLMEAVASEVLDHQEAMLGEPLDRPALLAHLARAIQADPSHGCRGRTAPDRLARVLADADRLGLTLPALRRLAAALP